MKTPDTITIDMTQLEYWQPTNNLRWRDSKFLEQEWISDLGKREWRNIENFNTKEK